VFGKILGGMIGIALGLLQSGAAGFVLGLMGLVVGHFYDVLHAPPVLRDTSSVPPRPLGEQELESSAQEQLLRHLCVLFAEVARADGEVNRAEVRAIREHFESEGSTGPALDTVRRTLKDVLRRQGDLAWSGRICRDALRPSERLVVLSALYDVALADGKLKRMEQDAVQRVADALGVSPEDQLAIANLQLGEGHQYFAALGLEPSASDDQVKAAFRRLAAANHPDKAAHLGAVPMERASRRFQEIKEAYDEIRKRRGQ
jgi:DnaJ like chaperone protein